MGYWLNGWGSLPGRERISSLLHNVQTGFGVHLASYSMEPENISPEIKGPGREADHQTPYNVKVKNVGGIPTNPCSVFMAKAKLTTARFCTRKMFLI
jgi:hypothetical protein